MAAQTAPVRASTQNFLEVEDIKEDLVILSEGSAVLIIQTTAVNFGLLSEEEQEAMIYAFAAFLNSLSFPIQILIASRSMDISSYLDRVVEEEKKQTSTKIKEQLRKYYQFILGVVKENKVLEKKFYLVIPFSALELGVKGAFPVFGKKGGLPFPKDYIISRAKTALFPKRDHLLRQLARIGLKGEQLNTQKLIELLYEIYNPQISQEEKVVEGRGVTTPIVQSIKEVA